MEPRPLEAPEVPLAESPPVRVDRGNTGIRILLTLLFGVIWAVLESVLGVVVLFSIVWALISRQTPPERLREFSNALVSYSYRIWRYLTYAEPQIPFPFSEFPTAVERLEDLGEDEAAEVHELLDARTEDDES